MRATTNCTTSNVVYVIQCRRCAMQCVGDTKKLHIHLNGHRSDITHGHLQKPVASHFNQPSHTLADLSIMVLEVRLSQSVDLHKKRESFWIYQLKTLHLGGMNFDPSFSSMNISYIFPPAFFCSFFLRFFSPACSFLLFSLALFFLISQFCPYSSLVFLKFLFYCLVTVI